jgi:hypothetical protein
VVKGLPGKLIAGPGVYATGFVDRIEDFLGRAKVPVVCDLPGSTGLSMKALWACAYRLPIAATSDSMRGLNLKGAWRPARDAAQFAREIARLLSSSAERRRRARLAAQVYKANYSKTAFYRTWDEVLASTWPKFRD